VAKTARLGGRSSDLRLFNEGAVTLAVKPCAEEVMSMNGMKETGRIKSLQL